MTHEIVNRSPSDDGVMGGPLSLVCQPAPLGFQKTKLLPP